MLIGSVRCVPCYCFSDVQRFRRLPRLRQKFTQVNFMFEGQPLLDRRPCARPGIFHFSAGNDRFSLNRPRAHTA
ncbi:hypothetical protein SAMN05414139_10589 [Burkholderia sp. D7]|nr:hypothetical protein SAMN05414139_10589 [Burkholderia sp. D7]